MLMQAKDIDWSDLIGYMPLECECRCGQVFLSHARSYVNDEGVRRVAARLPCPACWRCDDIRRASTDWEVFELRKAQALEQLT